MIAILESTVPFVKIFTIGKKLRFFKVFHNEDYVGNMWIFALVISVLLSTKQHFTFYVDWFGMAKNPILRRNLLNSLSNMRPCNIPWTVVEDFNTTSSNGKLGYVHSSQYAKADFNERNDDSSLYNFSFFGFKFT